MIDYTPVHGTRMDEWFSAIETVPRSADGDNVAVLHRLAMDELHRRALVEDAERYVQIRRTTDQLEVGDVVLTHGMRVLLDSEPYTHPGAFSNCTVYVFSGRILNVEEVRSTEIYWAEDGRYTIQGNHLATWFIERAV